MIDIKAILQYFNRMHSEGKKITQEHINRFLDAQDLDGFDTSRYRNGGKCNVCGKSFRLTKMENVLAEYEWYLPECICEEE